MASAILPPDLYLILGGTIIGRYVANLLAQRGETRIAIFDAIAPTAEQASQLVHNVQILVGDILDSGVVSDTIKSFGATCIIHTATPMPHFSTSAWESMTATAKAQAMAQARQMQEKVNIDTTRHLLDASLAHGVKKLVYMSKADVVFDGAERPMLTERAAVIPKVLWDNSLEFKVQGERLVLRADGAGDLRTAVIRPAEPFGPGSYTNAHSLDVMQGNPKLAGSQVGDNTNLVDRAYFANIAHALILAADRLSPAHPKHAAVAGSTFFITDGAPRPFFDFYRSLWRELTGEAPKLLNENDFGRRMSLFLSYLRADPPDLRKKIRFLCTSRSYDITFAREALDYAPIVSYEEGIRETVKWYREKRAKEFQEKPLPPPYTSSEGTFLAEKVPFL
ncbi:3-beta hydroxysteroid dehydrogenase/isomerase family-domain-containing protein [Mycena latifolia]|nr:3-beta hydroxysteroid dehydrogenase/isomerase family-domain-containing protein [Mycena latifolia]